MKMIKDDARPVEAAQSEGVASPTRHIPRRLKEVKGLLSHLRHHLVNMYYVRYKEMDKFVIL
jgi:hypothetical protein